ncbi:hypothetical protein [Dubosiella newyorkensis]|uniref:hypothetical protein n=1 Tax=Dubosiella newyorkensis TaxID=1862672 RepID=UPI00257350EB|nr:hypothetical protein [Dubosiella newyorkensis]
MKPGATAPCYRCPKRAPTCHGECASYLHYVKQQEEARKQTHLKENSKFTEPWKRQSTLRRTNR